MNESQLKVDELGVVGKVWRSPDLPPPLKKRSPFLLPLPHPSPTPCPPLPHPLPTPPTPITLTTAATTALPIAATWRASWRGRGDQAQAPWSRWRWWRQR